MNNTGNLKIHCFYKGTYRPVYGVEVQIIKADSSFNDLEIIGTYTTGDSGIVENLVLDTPDINNTTIKGSIPYGIYNIRTYKPGYKSHYRRGAQVFPGLTAIHDLFLEDGEPCPCAYRHIVISEHKQVQQLCSKCSAKGNNCAGSKANTCGSLKTDIAPKRPIDKKANKKNSRIKSKSLGMRVLPQVEVPSSITVHDGAPSNTTVANYTINFIDYIKNVACSELYPTWDSNALRANIYAIVSFTLNRVYTEWYPSRGYNFDITNDTEYDQDFVEGRTIYDSISVLVDQLFDTYIQRWGDSEPLLAEFCNGTTSTCPNWLSQWGSQYLATQGYTPYEILTNYYGYDIDLVTATQVNGYPSSFPGVSLTLWSSGENVKIKQNQLNEIGKYYPAIAPLTVDGIYGPKTQAAVTVFQGIFNLPQTGIINKATWYSISKVYVGVTGQATVGGEPQAPS